MINLKITGQKLTLSQETLAEQTINYLEVEASFTNDWNGLKKYVHFTKGNENYAIELVNDKISKDQHLNLSKGEWIVSVHGNELVNGTVTERITTTVAQLYVKATGNLNGEPLPITPASVGEQILAKAEQALTNSSAAVTKATEAKTESASAKAESSQAKSDASSALTKANKALNDLTSEITRAKARENEIEAKIPSHDNFATKTELQAEETRAKAKEVEIEGKIPTKTSQLTNDSGFVDNTYHDSTKVDKEEGKGLFSGSYNDLTDKPTIPEAQIQSDWNQTDSTKPDYIKNKPDELGLVDDVKVNGTSVVDASGVANVTVPTKTSDITNDSGFIDNTYHDATKQDAISDLETIRDGASKGATAIQEHQSLAAYRTAQEQDAIHDSTKQDVLTQADKQAIADLKDISGKVDKVEGKGLSTNDYTDADKTKVANAITEHQDISGKQDKTDNSLTTTSKTIVGGINELKQEIAQKQDEITSDNKLSYNLLKDTPTIPDVSGKQDKLIAGLNITIDADGKTINAVGGSTDIGLSIQDGQLCITYVKENN